jgi:hypothetical protein
MPEIDTYFDEIDKARLRRARELSEVKRIFGGAVGTDPLGVKSKAIVVLSYAAWEGFYNDCITTYQDFLKNNGFRVADANWKMLVGALSRDFESLRAKNHTIKAKTEFVESLRHRLMQGFEEFDASIVRARSNLQFERLQENFALLGFDISEFQRYRLRIDKELVGWRNGVAHGDAPNLDQLDVEDHIKFVSQLLRQMADRFQDSMLSKV